MLDLKSIKVRAASRLAVVPEAAGMANPANRLVQLGSISQLATLAAPTRRDPGRYALTRSNADAAHAESWDEATCARFVTRATLVLRRGIDASNADDLAERLYLRDVQMDDRVMCVECQHLAGGTASRWRCRNHERAGVAADLPAEMTTTLQRCEGFEEP